MFRNKTLMLIIKGISVTLLLAFPAYLYTKKTVNQLANHYNSKLSPVIMIPGSSATENRFNELVDSLNEVDRKEHSLLKVKVWDSGKITYQGKIKVDDSEPVIVIGFENNKDGYQNILKQAKMFNLAFKSLTDKYDFNNFKAIGHSNGGLVYTAFLEKYFKNYEDIELKKLLMIASPFNFSESSNSKKTQMLNDFIKEKQNIPPSLITYVIAGTENYQNDGYVPVESVLAAKYVYQQRVKQYTEITVTGINAEHSNLPQNKQIVGIIRQYILDKNIKRNQTK